MRLFVAVCLSPEMKNGLEKVTKNLRKDCVRGNFTRTENFHLTLAFIGEEDPKKVIAALTPLAGEAFTLKSKGLGWFRNRGGDIAFVRCEESVPLVTVRDEVVRLLKAGGISLDTKPFRAHLTLGREVVPFPDFDEKAFSASIPAMMCDVAKVSLMSSERVGGKLVYREIWKRELSVGSC